MLRLKEDIFSAFSFFTIIPISGEHFSERAINFMFLPYILVGLILTGFLFSTDGQIGHLLLAALSLLFIVIFHGGQNVDSLLDFGDGLMKRGTSEERLKAMKDLRTGAGGVIIFFFVYLITIITLSIEIKIYLIFVLLYGQIMSVEFMAVGLYKSKPLGEGFVYYFRKQISGVPFLVLNVIFPAALSFVVFPEYAIQTIMLILIAFFLRRILYRKFEGVNGDMAGATGEVGRMLSLLLVYLLPIYLTFL